MSDYYTPITDFAPYTKVTSSELDAEFTALDTGLDLLPSQAQMDSANTAFVTAGGTVNAITCSHPLNTWTTYVGKNGSRLNILITAANTGAVTLAVDGLGTQACTDNSGAALAADALALDGFYEFIYHEADSEWRVSGSDSSTDAAAAAASATAAAASAASIPTILGRQTYPVPAASMTSRPTAGASNGTLETSTNKVIIHTKDFSSTVDEFVQFAVSFPKGWDASTITVQFKWSHPATTTNFGVRFFMRAVAFVDGDALDTAFGTAVGHTADTGGTTDDIYTTVETAAITIGNTPAKSDYIVFEIYRDVSDAGDTMAVNARLHEAIIYYDIDAYSDD